MSAPAIHPTASVDPRAELGPGVSVGPYAVIEAGAVVGDGCAIGAHAVVKRYTRLGANNVVHEHAVLGGAPQDLRFRDMPTYLEIGTGNVLREAVVLNRATREGEATRIGSGNYLMNGVHIGHDCRLGDGVVLAPCALLGGFVAIADRAFVSGGVAIHQFCRVGTLAMVGGLAKVVQDCLPYVVSDGNPARARGLNLVGLRRAGFGAAEIAELKRAYRTLLLSGLRQEEALARLAASPAPAVAELVAFVRESRRGVAHGAA